MECLEHHPPRESGHVIQLSSSLLHVVTLLLGSTTLLSDLVDEGDRLSNIGLDILRKLALVAEDFSSIHTSGDER